MKLNLSKFAQFEKGKLCFKAYSQLNNDELGLILEFRNNPAVRTWMFDTEKITLKEHIAFVQSLTKAKDKIYFSVFKKNKIIGSAYATAIIFNQSCEWGIYLNPVYIGTGIGIEIEFHFLQFLFDDLGMRKISGWVNKHNFDSIPIQEKFGFKRSIEKNSFLNLVLQRSDWNQMPGNWTSFRKKLLSK